MEEKEHILVIKHGALGDFVMAMPMMAAIRARHPDAHITLITQGSLTGLAKCTRLFDGFAVDNRTYKPKDWWYIIKETIADKRYSVIYDLQSNNRTLVRYAPLARFATRHPMVWAKRVKGGFVFRSTGAKLPYMFSFPKSRFVAMAPIPFDMSKVRGEGKNFGLLPERYVLLIPGCSAGNTQKRWPADRYREVSLALGKRGIKTVVLGTKDEEKEISTICRDNPDAVDFMGKAQIADIPEMAARSLAIIGNDTGPTHIAWRTGRPTIMCFTTFDAGRAAPKNAPNVQSLVADKIDAIPFDAVMEKLSAILTETKA
ncbi:MAG: glycosyltransferase family 9 protein [Kiritimatiellae bacterium]|nr:glycosyltransferase family 9 protein [Kiritimatiellia bacterium]